MAMGPDVVPPLLDLPRPTARSFRDALTRHGLTAEEYLGERGQNDFMPWDVIESGMKATYLRYELKLSERAKPGHRCPPGAVDCLACGVCVPEAGSLKLADQQPEISFQLPVFSNQQP